MSRIIRQLSNSAIYHILIQGYNKEPIFKADSDKNFFINILLDNVSQSNLEIFAYCIMDNHAHLVIRDFKYNLSTFMKEITKKYAHFFNKTYERSGKVFHDRFKSEPIEDAESLISVLTFIHNDPLRANIVNQQERYMWSSYNFHLDNGLIKEYFVTTNKAFNILSIHSDINPQSILKCTNDTSNCKFLDCDNINTYKTILNEYEAKLFVKDYLESKNETLESIKTNWELRYTLVKELKDKSNLSIRKIAYILSLTRGIVQNIK